MAAVRRAQAVWEGDLTSGSGTVSSGTSALFDKLPISWISRTEAPGGRTSPEELLAAAHAGCFAMALSHGLAQAGTPAQKLEVSAEVTFDRAMGAGRSSRARCRCAAGCTGATRRASARRPRLPRKAARSRGRCRGTSG